jgi:hypothetical protein
MRETHATAHATHPKTDTKAHAKANATAHPTTDPQAHTKTHAYAYTHTPAYAANHPQTNTQPHSKTHTTEDAKAHAQTDAKTDTKATSRANAKAHSSTYADVGTTYAYSSGTHPCITASASTHADAFQRQYSREIQTHGSSCDWDWGRLLCTTGYPCPQSAAAKGARLHLRE